MSDLTATVRSVRSRLLDGALLVLAGITAVAALPAGGALIVDPSGAALGLSNELLVSTPFVNFIIPGLVLFLFVGVLALVAVITQLRRRPGAWGWSMAAGVVLLGWLGVQVLMLGQLHALHVVGFIIGGLQVVLSWRAGKLPRGAAEPQAASCARGFLSARRIAFVGLSRDPKHFSRGVAKAMRSHGVVVVPVNPRADTIDGETCYPTVAAIPAPPHVCFVMRPPRQAVAVVEDCIDADVDTVWFHHGAGLPSHSEAALKRAQAAGIHTIHGLCPMMFMEPAGWLHRTHRDFRLGGLARARSAR